MSLHALAAVSFRNARKPILFEKWVSLGMVTVFFDATMPDIIMPKAYLDDFDMYIVVAAENSKITPTGIEGFCRHPTEKTDFDFFISWDSISAMHSHGLNEKHTWYEDAKRAVARANSRQQSKIRRTLPS